MALVVGGLLALCIASGTAIAIFGPPNSGTESQTANTARPSSATATERPAGPAPQAVQPTAGVPSSPVRRSRLSCRTWWARTPPWPYDSPTKLGFTNGPLHEAS